MDGVMTCQQFRCNGSNASRCGALACIVSKETWGLARERTVREIASGDRKATCVAWQHGSLGSWLCSSGVSAPSMRCMPTPRVCADSRLPQRLRRASADQSRFPGPEAARESRGSADMLFLCWAREAGMLRARSGTSPRLSQTGQTTQMLLSKVTTAVRMTMTMAATKMARSLLANPLASPLINPLVNLMVSPLANPLVNPLDSPLVNPLVNLMVSRLVSPLANPLVNPMVNPLINQPVSPLASPMIIPLVSSLVSPLVSRLFSLLILDYH